MADKVRTRFAPSPTGYMHIGNLRTALYAYLFARKNNGSFILRIEDTDRERYVEGTAEVIYETLRSTGLIWDEGPLVGGAYGPYIQSERKDSYLEYALALVDKGYAYYCFCSKDRLAGLKNGDDSSMYDKRCRSMSKSEVDKNLDAGLPYVIRQKMPDSGKTFYEDLVYGHVEIDNSELEDQVLIKSDGMPTYNFANVIDDHLMDITHIIRGNEYLTSTPKYNLLYDSFGWEKPVYMHLPMIMASHTEVLSKRTGSASFQDLVKEGFLPDAIINYIALLGWSPGTTQEIFTLEELIDSFDISGINRSPSIFDKNKLIWMNGEYMHKMPDDEFAEKAVTFLKKHIKRDVDLYKAAALLHKRINVFSEIAPMVDFIDDVPEYDIELYVNKKMKTDTDVSLTSLKAAYDTLALLEDFTNDGIYAALTGLASKIGLKNSQILWPVRTALTGRASSPGGATELAELFGKNETLERIAAAVAKLSDE